MRGVIVAALLVYALSVSGVRYDGYRVVRVKPTTGEQMDTLAKFLEQQEQLDVWREPSLVDEPVDIMLSPDQFHPVCQTLKSFGLDIHVMINDVQDLTDSNMKEIDAASKRQAEDRWDSYHRFDDIMDWVERKATECAEKCEIIEIGKSTEGRVLKVIRIGTPRPNKQQVWIDSGIHAREWIAHAMGQYIIERLIDDYDTDPKVRALVDGYDWYILPVVNPDGYVYSWDEDRLWRKSRSRNESTNCVGADVNRNFDYMWMTIGASDDPCSNTFAGFFPLSEPEAAAQASWMREQEWQVFITMHSYSQLWMAPWGYTTEQPPNYDQLMVAGRVAVDALTRVYGTPYRLGSASEILYASSGTSRDWAGGQRIPYVYTIELRDQGQHGFVLPPEQILPTGRETWAGIKEMVYFILTSSPEDDQ